MIISVDKAKSLISFPNWTDEKIEMKLKAVEQTIRAYTNNNFQVRTIRSICSIENGKLIMHGFIDGFAVGDTVQITESGYNNGLYVITQIDRKTVSVDCEPLTNDGHGLVTKVVYPADVVNCCVDLMEWSAHFAGKVGIKSETLSRHSVTYEDSATMFMGYPAALLGCLKPYRKARC